MPDEIIQTPEEGTGAVPPVAQPPVEPVISPTPPIDYEEKFSASSRENQILQERIKTLEASGKDLTKEPTDSDLRSAFPDWENLTDGEKADKRRIYNAERTSAVALKTAQDVQADRSWERTIEMTVIANSDLQGKEQAFRQYAMQPKYRGVAMELLVDAFLGKNATVTPAPRPTPKPGLETGNGGPRTPEKPKTISTAELNSLRTTNPRAYQDYLKTHPIELPDA